MGVIGILRRPAAHLFRAWCQNNQWRGYSAAPSEIPQRKVVELPVGGSGDIQISISPPLRPPAPPARPSFLVHLPSSSYFGSSTVSKASPLSLQVPFSTAEILSSLLPSTTVITIHYRLSSSSHLFPVPIHDTFTAVDYIRNEILETPPPDRLHASRGHEPLISLYGSYIGGSLGLSLALTEPSLFHAVAVSSPITNWVDLEDSDLENVLPRASSRRLKSRKLSRSEDENPKASFLEAAVALRSLRASLFSKAEFYFDAFASPTLFLRTPGRDPPVPGSALDPYLDANNYNDDGGDVNMNANLSVKRRRVLKRWPPYPTKPGRSRTIQGFESRAEQETLPPWTRVLVTDSKNGQDSILRHQGYEMIELMRRACFFGRGDSKEAEELVGVMEIANDDIGSGTHAPGEWIWDKEVEMARRAGEWIWERQQIEQAADRA